MSGEKTIFLDFDDTLSDPFRLLTQLVREIGAILTPQYGGEPDDWAKSAIAMLQKIETDYVKRFLLKPLNGYNNWREGIYARAGEWLFEEMGLPVPENIPTLVPEVQFTALTHCNAAFPGAKDALQTLSRQNVRIFMASGQASEYLQAALIGAELEAYTEARKFGPDLINCAKEGPEYYQGIFAAVGIKASDALIVDDHPGVISWALQLGATVIQAKLSPERHYETVPGVAAVLTDLRDLPELVQQHQG